MLPLVLEIESLPANGLCYLLCGGPDILVEHLIDTLVLDIGWLHVQLFETGKHSLLQIDVRVHVLRQGLQPLDQVKDTVLGKELFLQIKILQLLVHLRRHQ